MLLSQLQPYLDELTHHISDLMMEVGSQNETIHGHLRSFRLGIDLLPMHLQQPARPTAAIRQSLNELWGALDAFTGGLDTRLAQWRVKILRDTLACLAQNLDEEGSRAFEFPIVTPAPQPADLFFTPPTSTTTTCETTVRVVNSLRDALMQQAERIERDVICLDLSTQVWNDLQIRSLTILDSSLQHIMNTLDDVPLSYAPLSETVRHDLFHHLTLIQGLAQLLLHRCEGQMSSDATFSLQNIRAGSQAMTEAIEAERQIYELSAS